MNPQIGSLLNQALEALRNSSLEMAEFYLKEALKLESNNPHTLRLLGVVEAQRAEYQKAIAFFSASITALPENPVAHSNLGNVYVRLRQFDQALSAYEQAASLDPNDAETWSNAGIVFFELKRFEESIGLYDKALAIDPNFNLAREYLGEGYLAAGRVDLAMNQLAEIARSCGVTCEEYKELNAAITTAH